VASSCFLFLFLFFAFLQPLLQWKGIVYYTACVCVCSLRYPACKAHWPMSSVACPAQQYYSTLSHKRHDFRKNVTEHKICVSSFYTTFTCNISHSKKKWARYDRKCVSVVM